jgi:methionyl-tRNA formyltransferase
MSGKPRIAFFGTPDIAAVFLDVLRENGLAPALVVTAPDRPAGRGLTLTPPPVAQWARARDVPFVQPEKLDDAFIESLRAEMLDVCIVVAYGHILPQALIDLPMHKTLNVHFSLLPRWRGASPVESAILAGDAETGCAIQIMRAKLDTGPLIAAATTPIAPDETAPELRARLGDIGARLLVETLPRYLAGELAAREQDDAQMTYAKKMRKEDGDITNDDDKTRWRKYRAYYGWPGTYFFALRTSNSHASASASLRGPAVSSIVPPSTPPETASPRLAAAAPASSIGKPNMMRIKITAAHFENDRFVIDRVVPEGKREMPYADFLRARQH